MRPVVGPRALRKATPLGPVTTMSVPPWVRIWTTLGATLRTAALMAFSDWSLTSSCPAGGWAVSGTQRRAAPPRARETANRRRHDMRVYLPVRGRERTGEAGGVSPRGGRFL